MKTIRYRCFSKNKIEPLGIHITCKTCGFWKSLECFPEHGRCTIKSVSYAGGNITRQDMLCNEPASEGDLNDTKEN
jgi:hypothetical protein